MLIRTLTDEDGPRWDSFVAGFPAAQFAHAIAFRTLIEKVFRLRTHYLLGESEDGEIRAICPLVGMRSLLHLNRKLWVGSPFVTAAGILASDQEAERLLHSHLHQLAVETDSVVQLRSHTENRLIGPHTFEGYTTLCLDLSSVRLEAEWSIPLSSRNRTKVRKARKNGISTCFGQVELLDTFYALYFQRQREFGTPAYPKALFELLLEHFPKSEIGIAYKGTQPVSTVFNIGFLDTLHYAYGGSDQRYLKLYPNNLLFFEMIERAHRHGFEILDFGRSEKGSGTYRFKEQWGATPVALAYQYLGPRSQEFCNMSISGVRTSLAFRVFHFIWSRCLPDAFLKVLGPQLIKRMPLA